MVSAVSSCGSPRISKNSFCCSADNFRACAISHFTSKSGEIQPVDKGDRTGRVLKLGTLHIQRCHHPCIEDLFHTAALVGRIVSFPKITSQQTNRVDKRPKSRTLRDLEVLADIRLI